MKYPQKISKDKEQKPRKTEIEGKKICNSLTSHPISVPSHLRAWDSLLSFSILKFPLRECQGSHSLVTQVFEAVT